MNLIKHYSDVNTSVRKGEIKYIVIHFTAGVTSSGKSDENTAAWFAKSTTKASSDFIVDDDSVSQFNQNIKGRYTWHCGGNKYANTKGGKLYGVCTNSNSIGIEICSCNKTGKVTTPNDSNWYYTESAINNAVELVKILMEEYNIPVDNVIRHWDVNGKPCPGIIGWNADSGDESQWLSFKKKLVASNEPDYKKMYEELLVKYNKLENKLNSIKKIIEE